MAITRYIAATNRNRLNLDPMLDNYVEAHVHGVLQLREDIEAVVLDPNYRDTIVEKVARALGSTIEWTMGIELPTRREGDCFQFRGPAAAEALSRVAVQGVVTPAILGIARANGLENKTAKWLWHCMVRYGQRAL